MTGDGTGHALPPFEGPRRCGRCGAPATYRVADPVDVRVPLAWTCTVDLGPVLGELGRDPDVEGWAVQVVVG